MRKYEMLGFDREESRLGLVLSVLSRFRESWLVQQAMVYHVLRVMGSRVMNGSFESCILTMES